MSRSYVMQYLYELYIKNGIDIFNYKLEESNRLTYHHIIPRRELKVLEFPTTKTIENGIALTEISHSYIHLIEVFAPDIFFHINKVILLITKEQRLPTPEERNLLQILLEAFEYRMNENYKINPKYLKRVLVS